MNQTAFDRILVVDVESTCWQGAPPTGEVSEIIEIGVCPVDLATLRPADATSILVRPTRSRVSEFCTQLTSITPAMVADAPDFAAACARLSASFNSRRCVWASWGGYDRAQFERCCRLHNVDYPFGPRHLNLKTLHAVGLGRTRETGMAGALRELGLPLRGTHHRGGDDAASIAAILCELFARLRRPAT